jgi:hypothetical protein
MHLWPQTADWHMHTSRPKTEHCRLNIEEHLQTAFWRTLSREHWWKRVWSAETALCAGGVHGPAMLVTDQNLEVSVLSHTCTLSLLHCNHYVLPSWTTPAHVWSMAQITWLSIKSSTYSLNTCTLS